MKKYILAVLLIVSTPIDAITQKFHLAQGWFPSEKNSAHRTMTALADQAKKMYAATVKAGSVRAIIVPHAGVAYSGAIASGVYALVQNVIRRVIILAPDHSGTIDGVALPYFDTYAIPTGKLSVDTQIVQKLSKKKHFTVNGDIFAHEHSLAMQLPFIHKFLPHASIVPLIIGDVSCLAANDIAQVLTNYIDQTTLIVVSSDFVHYGKKFGFTPFKDHQQCRIRQLNSQAIALIEAGNCAPFANFISSQGATICGVNPLKIFLAMLAIHALGTVEPRLIAYDTSTTNDNDDSVSYIGMLFTNQRLSSLPFADQLTQQEKRNIADEASNIMNHLFDKNLDISLYYPLQSLGVTQSHGAFATFKKKTEHGEELRGCIGRMQTDAPLYKTVAAVIQDAALRDPRFDPITADELPDLRLTISILSPLKTIDNYKNIRIGQQGVVLQYGNKSALFLPEVPLEFNWNIETMLNELAQKAGLRSDVWRNNDAILQIFTTVNIEIDK
ncbi:AmmeMemoRadiSam system protein B [Candidatus Dependentiae bacterium]|nr:AmmeMemoRadiSam system protein B [Candidatus Dependentiae bacterium]